MIVSVSVIMPFLNQGPFLGQAIDSVRSQTVPDWELLLVDDGSRDESPDIAAAHAAADPDRIKLLRHADGGTHGAAASRNLALAQASGEFISFLDADDLYEKDKLETEVALIRAVPEAMMLYGPTLWWYPESKRPLIHENPGVATGRVYDPPFLLVRLLLRHEGNGPCTCAVLIRRVAALGVGGFEEGFRLYEDQTLWAKLFLRYPVYVSPRPTSRYRQHADSTSSRALLRGEYHAWRRHPAEMRFFEWLMSHVEASGIDDPTLAREIDRAMGPYQRRSAAVRRWARDLGRLTLWRTGRPLRKYYRTFLRKLASRTRRQRTIDS